MAIYISHHINHCRRYTDLHQSANKEPKITQKSFLHKDKREYHSLVMLQNKALAHRLYNYQFFQDVCLHKDWWLFCILPDKLLISHIEVVQSTCVCLLYEVSVISALNLIADTTHTSTMSMQFLGKLIFFANTIYIILLNCYSISHLCRY